ncbi:DNA transfer protein [Escherichia phage vB-Eco-KMB41]|nr:DNA transfer protein [Escherichia phage vB-Eco-KMB41]
MAQLLGGGGGADPGDLWNNLQNIQAAGTNTLQNIGLIQNNTAQQIQNRQQGMAMKAAQVNQEQMAQFNKDWQAAAGDPSAIQALAYKYPNQIEALQKRLGLTDQIRQQQGSQLASQADVAIAQGPEAAAQFVQQNAPALQAMGIDPNAALQAAQNDPDAFRRSVQALHLASNTSKDQLDYAKEVMKNTTTIRGQDLNAASQAADRNLRYIGLQNERLNTRIAQEKNDIERGKYAQQQAKLQADSLNTKRDFLQTFDKTLAPIDTSLDLAKQLLARKDLGYVTGINGYGNRFWSAATGGGDNTAEIVQTLDQLKSQARLAGMESLRGTGSVTEKEGEAAANALLNANPGQMSEDQLKAVIQRYVTSLEKGKAALEKNQGGRVESYRREIQLDDAKQEAIGQLTAGGIPQQNAQAALNYLMQNPTPSVKEQFKAKYGFLPEGL